MPAHHDRQARFAYLWWDGGRLCCHHGCPGGAPKQGSLCLPVQNDGVSVSPRLTEGATHRSWCVALLSRCHVSPFGLQRFLASFLSTSVCGRSFPR
jgi:hypothetical protein